MRHHRKPNPLFDPDHAGLDMAAIRADDALLDSLHAAQPTAPTSSDPLREELLKLRDSTRGEVPELVDVDTAVAVIAAGRRSRKHRTPAPRGRTLVVLVALVAVVGIVLILLTGCTPARSTDPQPPTIFTYARSLAVPTGDGGPKVIVAATSDVTGAYPSYCVRGAAEDPRLPVMSCTPGSVRSDITDATKAATICNPHWSTGSIRAPQSETDRLKTIAMVAYGVPASARSVTELDHDVPLWLGGSNDVTNLWPQRSDLPGQGFRNSKDDVETRLHTAVCGHIRGMRPVPLRAAQVAIARNWTTAEAVLGIPA
jgi:hypothetical protein